MKIASRAMLAGLVLSLAVSFYLWRENARLRQSLPPDSDPGEAAGKPPQAPHGDSSSVASRSAPVARRPEDKERKTDKPARPLKIAGTASSLAITDAHGRMVLETDAGELQRLANQAALAAEADRIKAPGGPSWSPGQAAGPPDTETAGDRPTAWAPQAQDGGNEWLQLKYARPVELQEVTVYESYNAGAITRILATLPDGKEKVLWSGGATPEEGLIERVVKVPPGIRSDQIRVELDTTRVPGWNEIDAVEIVGRDGSRQWASEASASSYFGQRNTASGLGSAEGAGLALDPVGR